MFCNILWQNVEKSKMIIIILLIDRWSYEVIEVDVEQKYILKRSISRVSPHQVE